jgi:hypothetical protein
LKTSIDSRNGLVVSQTNNGFSIDGKDYHEAIFDNRWDDLSAIINEGSGAAALTYESYRDTGFHMRFFRHNQDDNIFMTYQMPHMWNTSTSVYPHMHYIPVASGSGTLKFSYAYSWLMVNSGTLGAGSSWVTGSVSASLDASLQYMQKVISFGQIVPPSNAVESCILVFKVERPGASDASDTYTTSKDHGTASANVAVLYFDLHYQKQKAGTVSQLPEGP